MNETIFKSQVSTREAQRAYNKLASIQQYLLWFDDLDADERFGMSFEQQAAARDEAFEIIRAAKHETLESNGAVSVSLSWEYSDKWQEIHSYSRALTNKVREALRPILGYV